MSTEEPPPFPAAAGPLPPLSDALRKRGVVLRRARASDLPAFRRLYAEQRAPELALAPWSVEMKQAFCDDQFGLQHQHFTRQFAGADFLVIERGRAPRAPEILGRLYLDRSSPVWRIVDIGLFAHERGRGLGSALLEWVAASARAASAAETDLHVLATNGAALRLYERLGYRVTEELGAHLKMVRPLS
jgi:ribosomal protein S18 acetylase RimI-like enzyme